LGKPLTWTQHRVRAVWVFSLILLAVLGVVVVLDRNHLAGVSQPILAVFAGLLAGLLTFFLTGDLGLRLPWLRATGGLGIFSLVLLLWPKLLIGPGPGLYRVLVSVFDPQGEAVEEATVWSVPGGEKKNLEKGWELDIPAASLPENKRLIIFAQNKRTSALGRRELILGKDLQPTVEINLPENLSAMVHGRVLDEGGKALSGVKVSVAGFDHESVTTDAGGTFTVPAHSAPGQMVRLRAEKQGFPVLEQDHPAGTSLTTMIMEHQ